MTLSAETSSDVKKIKSNLFYSQSDITEDTFDNINVLAASGISKSRASRLLICDALTHDTVQSVHSDALTHDTVQSVHSDAKVIFELESILISDAACDHVS
ncbi:hypothetical protein BgiBS90_026995 [Biomphalaria glabrata]|nr:hypothetical protein BgiBS90_026995 [Biomphalaria glabrata]